LDEQLVSNLLFTQLQSMPFILYSNYLGMLGICLVGQEVWNWKWLIQMICNSFLEIGYSYLVALSFILQWSCI